MRIRAFLAVVALLCLNRTARAESAENVQLLFGALSADKALEAHAADGIKIAVVFKEDVKASADEKSAQLQAMQQAAHQKIRGQAVSVVELSYVSAAKLISAVRARGINVLYITAGMDSEVSAIRAIARATHAVTLSQSPEYLKQGLSLAVGEVKGKPGLWVSASAAKAEGLELDPALLSKAQVTE